MGGALFGMFLNRVLPPEHIGEGTRNTVNIAVGVIATLAALVLGLMVASAKASFDQRSDEIKQGAARVVLLNRALLQYGPEAKDARAQLHDLAKRKLILNWMETKDAALLDGLHAESSGIEKFQTTVRQLKPADDAQKWLQPVDHASLSFVGDVIVSGADVGEGPVPLGVQKLQAEVRQAASAEPVNRTSRRPLRPADSPVNAPRNSSARGRRCRALRAGGGRRVRGGR